MPLIKNPEPISSQDRLAMKLFLSGLKNPTPTVAYTSKLAKMSEQELKDYLKPKKSLLKRLQTIIRVIK